MYIVCSPQIGFVVPSVLGHPKASGPAPKGGAVLCWGDPRAECALRQARGSQESRTERSAGRESLSAAVPKTERATEIGGQLTDMNEPICLTKPIRTPSL